MGVATVTLVQRDWRVRALVTQMSRARPLAAAHVDGHHALLFSPLIGSLALTCFNPALMRCGPGLPGKPGTRIPFPFRRFRLRANQRERNMKSSEILLDLIYEIILNIDSRSTFKLALLIKYF